AATETNVTYSLITSKWHALTLVTRPQLPSPVDDATSGISVSAIFQKIATLRDQAPQQMELVVRFEADFAEYKLPPSEVCITTDDGRAVLVHLPDMVTQAIDAPAIPPLVPTGNVTLTIGSATVTGSNGANFNAIVDSHGVLINLQGL